MTNQTSVFILITVVFTMLSGAAGAARTARAQGNDEDVRWIEENGFDATHYMERCLSVDQYGREYTSLPLPVGNGWTMECTGYGPTDWWVMPMQGRDGTRYCVLGERAGIDVGGDSRLWIQVVDRGDHGPAQLQASANSPFSISTTTVFGTANVWPIWLSAHYDTVDIVRDPLDGRTCPQLFHVN